MADTLTERVTGQTTAAAVPVEVQVVMSDQTLLGVDDAPALIPGYGPLPAGIARDLLKHADEDARVWLRRLFADPETGALTQVESSAADLPPRDAAVHHHPRRHLSHPVVRRADPAPRPHPRPRTRRPDQPLQRSRAVRTVQLPQTNPRLDDRNPAGRTWPI